MWEEYELEREKIGIQIFIYLLLNYYGFVKTGI